MQMCIHRGTKEIGGNCIEIEAEGKRLVLNLGLPLDRDAHVSLPSVKGFVNKDTDLLGIFIGQLMQTMHTGLNISLDYIERLNETDKW